jgi:hypothetical protein
MELAQQHMVEPYWSTYYKKMTERRIDWQAVGLVLGRVPKYCQSKYKHTLESRMKKGPFTAEEDAVILQRVQEWGDRGQGLWVQLSQELGRPASSISRRWSMTLREKHC